jgi:hypothetical protein
VRQLARARAIWGMGGLARDRENGRYGILMHRVYGLRLGGEKGPLVQW